VDRRRGARAPAGAAGWKAEAILRPGVLVQIINVGRFGILLESPAALKPGRRAELQLIADEGNWRPVIAGQINRCRVVGVNPMRFESVIDCDVELPGARVSG
jgi:hypothetical protein